MASYRKRGDNWEYRITYNDPITRKRREKTKKGFRTKKEAMIAAAEAELNIDQQFYEKNDSITISEYLDLWFDTYKHTVKESSWKARKDSMVIIKKHIGSINVKNINASMYQKFLNDIAPNYAKNTLTGVHQVFKMMTKNAMRDSYFKLDPLVGIRLPRTKDAERVTDDQDLKDIKFWEKEEISKFLQCVKRRGRPQDLAMFVLLVYSGLRIGEAVALKWDKVDFEESIIRVRHTLYQQGGLRDNYKLLSPKTSSSIRNVPVPPQVINQLRILKHIQNHIKMENRDQYKDEGFVFTDKIGRPIPARNFNYKLDTYIKKSGVTRITPHNLRHTYASLLIDAEVKLKEAQKRLGHASSKTTLDIYSHIMKDTKTEAIVQFNAVANDIF
ncbi:site-specific integrase [Bacillus subtilis]|uniref:site-specific integrase n=1 Tax=Bacillus subtilis TaxID=1423 RepID=UPI000617B992|nr:MULTISPECIES: site-specific integrase [Bacillus]KKB91526.1 integrase [Bacillus sp. CMAA 1185]MBC9025768.1 tyrosine-type recombinase/integrase [Bacillus subtilis]MCJ2152669.1 site-specific integrase [Bacillus subtilis]MCR4381246.1 site-specific integrase [Bacillus subtilis]QGI35707.1 tyrosine-type recombinase/integrase [Bacillus subtilis]